MWEKILAIFVVLSLALTIFVIVWTYPSKPVNYAGHTHVFYKNVGGKKIPCITNEDLSYISCKWSK